MFLKWSQSADDTAVNICAMSCQNVASLDVKSQTVPLSIRQSFSFVDIRARAAAAHRTAAHKPAVITVKMSCHACPSWPAGSDARAQLMQSACK